MELGSNSFFRGNRYYKGPKYYKKFLKLPKKGQICVSRSNSFPDAVVPGRISKVNSSMRLLLILRDPVTRLVSDYIHTKDMLKDSTEAKTPFEDLVFMPNSLQINSSYTKLSLSNYAMHLPKWLEVFNRDQLLIVDGESFAKDPLPWLQKAEEFLNIKPHFKRKHFVYNEARGFYCHRKRGCMQPTKGRAHPKLPAEQVKAVKDYYKPFNAIFKQISGVHFDWLG